MTSSTQARGGGGTFGLVLAAGISLIIVALATILGPVWIEALFRDDSGNWFSLTQPKWLG